MVSYGSVSRIVLFQCEGIVTDRYIFSSCLQVVGGFGEGSVLASLRLALAIAQNGTKEQHSKLAISGILVPISDLLRSALSRGDIYKFSGSLALVRFCGPYVAAGQGGGLEAVRDAIRVATNVLTLPVNPAASVKQMETQETLKSECIAALESLSSNASLWSSISTDALPAIVRYIHSTSAGGVAAVHPRAQATKCAALRAVLRIVQVPSHAVSAAEAGLVGPLGQLLSTADSSSEENEVPMLALEVLHVIAANHQARQKARFLETGLVRSICAAIGKSASDTPKQPSDSRADVTFLGLEILHAVHSDIEGDIPTLQLFQSPSVVAFLDSVASEPRFVRALCSTLLLTTKMKLPRHDADSSGETEFIIPKLYGPPVHCVPEKCAGYDSTHDAAEAFLFTTSVYACALDTQKSDAFWKTVLLHNLPGSSDATECLRTSATLAAHFLAQLTNDHKSFVPQNPRRHEDYLSITRPLVRHRLLEALKDAMAELSGEVAYGPSADPYVTSLLVGFNVPHICLSLWRDPALLDLAFELIKQIVEQDPDEVLHLFVDGKAAIMSLFDLLNLDSGFESSTNVAEIRRFLASILGQLAENGLLTDAVERFDVRSSAIAALAAACLSEDERPPDDDEDMTSNQLSSVLMRCLVELCTVKGKDGEKGKTIRLAPAEAAAIAKNLGKKICHMVLSRFLERTKLKQFEMEEDENIVDAPDVAMLCAVAQHEDALITLRAIGGLHALSLVAAEGEVTALVALKKACSGDANVLLEGDTYLSMMNLISSDEHDATWRAESPTWRQLESSAFELLGSLCSGSAKGRGAVASADTCAECVTRAIEIVTTLADIPKTPGAEASVVSEDTDDAMEAEDIAEATEDAAPPSNGGIADKLPKPEPETEDFELGVAACCFLSSLVTAKIARSTLCKDADFVKAISHLACLSRSEVLQFAALDLLVSLAPYVSSEGPLSADQIGAVLKSVLSSGKKYKTTSTMNANRVYHSAVRGLTVVFDSIPAETQVEEADFVASLFMTSVKSCIVTRSTIRDEDRNNAAELSYTLTTALLLFRGKGFVDKVFTKEMLTSLMHMIQWRHDPKTTLGNTDACSWDASVLNCLVLLSSLLWRPDETLAAAGIDLQALAQTTLMLARPGKAPRKAIDVKSALARIADGPDASAGLAAQRVLDRLFS
jgi:hypothetical protein